MIVRRLALIAVCLAPSLALAAPKALTIEDRIAARRAVEEVYWRHRIWPADNPGPKPSLDQVLPASAIRARVEDDLRKSEALGTLWNVRVGTAQLQAEMRRMAAGTRNGAMLRELFEALDDDPVLIAECLTRPLLVDRLVRERFGDAGFDAWWAGERARHAAVLPPASGNFEPVVPSAASCTVDTWSALPSSLPTLTARSGPAAVWTGAEMIVWGGAASPTDRLDTGGLYDPATDSWRPTPTLGAPSERDLHTAVWTGIEMIVWGGRGWFDTNTGARYDPQAILWRPTATTGAPAPRKRHTAVWTGTRMVVWGGDAEGGGRYDPLGDTWTPVTTTGAPPASVDATAVWTGTSMIVWGGGPFETNAGGRYDPASDTWAATSTGANVPSARWKHSAVWTGSRMVVWGGLSGATLESTGGRYDPVTDTWQSTATTGAPTGRYLHAAIWSGDRMVIFAGKPLSGAAFKDGGRYHPVADSWQPTSLTGPVPSPRHSFAAVRAGNEMFVWGGEPLTATGARYCLGPCTPETWFQDADGDGYGSDAATTTACERPEGYSAYRGDCDDADTSIRPNAGETCDGIDDDCDGTIDDGFDPDGDGETTCGGDCNDGDPSIFTGAPQLCDGKNNDCADPMFPAVPPGEANADGDAFRLCQGDCHDGDAAVYPGAPQACDGKNNDCAAPGWPTVPANEDDADGDGYRLCANDCNDANPEINPGKADVCNGIDDDCSGQFDDDVLGVDTDADGLRNVCDNCRAAVNPGQANSDSDALGDACDNCISVANADQANADGDAAGDACDNCPALANGNQFDTDADRLGDSCDNCPYDANQAQSDFDHDAQGDLCDVDDGLIYVFATDENYVEWQQETGPATWNVYEGSLAVLRSSGSYTQAAGSNPLADRHCGAVDPWVDDLEAVPLGGAKFALATGVTGGVEGSLGTNSAGGTRANTNSCP